MSESVAEAPPASRRPAIVWRSRCERVYGSPARAYAWRMVLRTRSGPMGRSRGVICRAKTIRCWVFGRSSRRYAATSPLGAPVTKARVQTPSRGHWIRTALRKALPLSENSVSDTCLTLE